MKNALLLFIALLLTGTILAQGDWFQIPTGTSKKLNTITFPSPMIGYIGGNDSLLLKSIDGGQTWQAVHYTGIVFLPGGEHILKLQFLTESIGYMTVGPYSGSYKTTDGGQTWQPVALSANLCYNQALYFFDENNGFIGGSGCFQGELVDRQTNGTWSASTLGFTTNTSDNRVTDIDFYGSSFGLASSAGGRMLRTTDGGQTWDSIASPAGQSSPIQAVRILNDTLCYAGYAHTGIGFGILVSEDSGLTWEIDNESATFYYPSFYDLHQAGSGVMYAGGGPGWDTTGLIFSYMIADGWSIAPVDFSINSIASYSDSVVFAAGDYGYLICNVQPAFLGIDDPEISEHKLHVYPNPATSEITLDVYQAQKFQPYEIYTAAGQLAGKGRMEKNSIDVTHLPAGEYFLKLNLDDQVWKGRFMRK